MGVDTGWWIRVYIGIGSWSKMILAGLGGVLLAVVIKGVKRKKPEDDDNSSAHYSDQSDDGSDDIEGVAPRRKAKRASKKEGGESSGDIASNPTKDHFCRFCNMKFDKSQALGGHMNRHRSERESEEFQKAKNLVTQREQHHYGGWSMQGVAPAGTFQHGGNLMPNSPAVGAPSRQYFPSNQPTSNVNWPLFAQSQQPGVGYYNPQAQPSQIQAHHMSGAAQPSAQQPQLQFNPGQHPVQHPGQQMGGLQSRVSLDIAGQGLNPFQRSLAAAGPLTPLEGLDEIVQSGNAQTITLKQETAICVDSCGNIPPKNHPGIPPQAANTDFQSGQGQGGHGAFRDQHYTCYDQNAGSSALTSLSGENPNQTPDQACESGLLIHMPSSYQDSAGHDDFQGVNIDQTAPVVELQQEPTSSHAKVEH